MAVDAAVKLERPLLVKGEPGTGKTLLAEEIANTLGLQLFTWHIKSQTKALQGLYEYDAVSRLRDSQLGDDRVQRHPQLHQEGQALGRVRIRRAGRAVDRRDRQGRHRVSRTTSCRNSTAWSSSSTRLSETVKAPSTAPSSSSPRTTRRSCRTRSCAAASSTTSTSRIGRRCSRSSRCIFPEHQGSPGQGGDGDLLRRAQGAGAEEKALHLGAHRLAQAA